MGTDNCKTFDSDRENHVKIELTKLLVKNLFTSMPATILNSIILVIVLWNVVSRFNLLIWCLLNIAFVLVRYVLIGRYRRRIKKDNYLLWQWVFILSFVIAGLMFGSAALFFLESNKFGYVFLASNKLMYVVFLYLVVGGMVVGSVGSYHNTLVMFFSYTTAVIFIPTVVLFFLGTDITISMAIMGLIFFFFMSVNARRMNRDLREFLLLRYDNNLLVEQFNKEKFNTEKLNKELVITNNQLKRISRIDPLTGLKNRHYLFDILKPKIENEINSLWMGKKGFDKRKQLDFRGYGVISIDIDHFKDVNDNYGHDSGDMVLKQFSRSLCEKVRQDDVVARIGGEEFIIIIRKSSESNLSIVAEKIRFLVEKSLFKVTDNREISITCSMGILFYPFFKHSPGNMRVEHVFYLVDRALYVAKENGRNRIVRVLCSESDSLDNDLLKSITEDLNGAIENRQILFEF